MSNRLATPPVKASGNGHHSGDGRKKPPEHRERGDAEHHLFPLTDAGNGERLMDRHRDSLRFVARWDKPIVYTGRRWAVDEERAAFRLALETIRDLKSRGVRLAKSQDDQLKETGLRYLKWAHASESHRRQKDMLAQAATVKGATVMPQSLDADPWQFNVPNGTIDLRTCQLRKHDRDDLITKLSPVLYDPRASCPLFLSFLHRIFEGNKDLIDFIQRAVGYSLTGVTNERAMFILYGTGKNGKSTLLEVLRGMLGDYATNAAADTLMAKKHEGIPNDIARLQGARFVSATETDEGRHLAEGLVKQMTGGEDVLTARFLRAEFFEFKPQFKLYLATNHKPVIRGTDNGIWDRIKLIPFTVRIPEEEQDKSLAQKLRDELEGILNWAVRGCQWWQRVGLKAPQGVVDATTTYREEMDKLGDFIAEKCTVGPSCVAQASALYRAYGQWCSENGEEPRNQTWFGRSLEGKGFTKTKDSKGYICRQGIGLLAGG